jgi:hypothetical protein
MRKNTRLHQTVSCEGKRQFTSYLEAQRFLKSRHKHYKKKTHKALAIYKCDYRGEGHHFHIGNKVLKYQI